MGTPLGPKHIPYTYIDPLAVVGLVTAYIIRQRGSNIRSFKATQVQSWQNPKNGRLELPQIPRDPCTQIFPTLGPKVCKYYLHWAIWIPRECSEGTPGRIKTLRGKLGTRLECTFCKKKARALNWLYLLVLRRKHYGVTT